MRLWGLWRGSDPPRLEKRESQPFTDAITTAIVATAGGGGGPPADPSAIAALETAAGLYSRAFAGADVQAADRVRRAVRPDVLALIARNLIRRGESLHLIDVSRDGGLALYPAGSWDVRGSWREKSWYYRLDLFGPSGNVSRYKPGASVVHCRYAVDPARPWHGLGPLAWSRSTAALAANLENRLSEEAGAPVAHLLPVPQDGGPDDDPDADPLATLKADIRGAAGRTVLVETTAAAWGEGRDAAPRHDWKSERIGADPPASLPALRSDAATSVLAACGVPPSLILDSDGTAQREASRRWLSTSLQPVADLVALELSAKLETDVSLDFSGQFLHDLQGRAASFQKLIAGGVAVQDALVTSGLIAGSD